MEPGSRRVHARQIAAVFLPRLAVEIAQERVDAPLRETVVVLDDTASSQGQRKFVVRNVTRIVDATDDLREIGVAPPMRVMDAQRYLPAVQVRVVTAKEMEERLGLLAELCLRCSPVVEPGTASGPACQALFLDLTGFVEDSDRSLWRIERQIARSGHQLRVVVSPHKWLSLALAHAGKGVVRQSVVAAQVPVALERLPVASMGLSAELTQTLEDLGLHCAAALQTLRKRADLAGRLLAEARLAFALLTGDQAPVRGIAPPEVLEEQVDLDFGPTQIEPLLFLSRAPIERLCWRLQARHQRMGALRVRLVCKERQSTAACEGEPHVAIAFPEPSCDARAILRAFALRLEHAANQQALPLINLHRLHFQVTQAVAAIAAQREAFGEDHIPPDALGALLGELAGELPSGAVGQLQWRSQMLPEEMTHLVWQPQAANGQAAAGPLSAWRWPLRMLGTPRRLQEVAPGVGLGRSPFCVLEGEDARLRPYVRVYEVLTLHDKRRALGFIDPESEEIWVQGWFD